MRSQQKTFITTFLITALILVGLSSQAAHAASWTRQFGSASTESGTGIAVDSAGNSYVTGYTLGSLNGANAGSGDIFVTKYNASGVLQWTRQLGTTGWDQGSGIAVDSAGNSYVTGITSGGLDGNTSAGGWDLFVTKYSATGVKQWTRQFGSATDDQGSGIAVDSAGNSYVTGGTLGSLPGNTNAGNNDIFVTKYSTTGVLQWTRQLGTAANDLGLGIAVDSAGNSYVTGFTEGNLNGTNAGSADMFVTKYNTSGVLQWTRQLGTTVNDFGSGIGVDSSGNSYVTGWTLGGLNGANAGGNDIFVTKYNTSGVLQWTRQLGTGAADLGRGIAVDSAGNSYVTGDTNGNLDGNTSAGLADIFVTKYNTSGVKLWTRQLGTASNDGGQGIGLDSAGNSYVTGFTLGNLDGNLSLGSVDMFIMKTAASFTVTPSAGANGAISPTAPQTVNYGTTTQFTVTPGAGYMASVGGTCGGALVGTTYTTSAIAGDCTVSATFALAFTVTPSAGANGAISPTAPQTVSTGTTTQFTVTPATGYHVVTPVGGTCTGALVGNTYTTNAVTTDCTVTASFAIDTFAVTTSVTGGNGTVAPTPTVTVNSGATTAITVTPATGYHINTVTGTCGGNLVGNTYTTNAITAACTVSASFTLNNQPPTATSAAITTAEDTPGAGVTPNVTDPDVGDTHTFTILTQPPHGSANIVGNQLVYTPTLNYNGADTFTFRATDAGGLSVGGTANVTVTPVNDSPVPTAPAISTKQGKAATSRVSPNDPDAGDTHTYAVTIAPANGSAIVNAGGLATYRPNAGFTGKNSFTITVTDTAGATGTVKINVTVTKVAVTSASNDFNGDGKSDIMFHQAATGRNFMMLMNGRKVLRQGGVLRLKKSWSIVGNGDYNGDGKADILFHQASSGRNFMMLMNGRKVLSRGGVRRLARTWAIAGNGDYNGDGKADILFHQAATGRNFMMLMNGRTVLRQGAVRRLTRTWSVVGNGDYNGDGKADILFHQAATGRNFMMLMNGRTAVSKGFVRRLAKSWSVVNTQ